MNVRLHQLVAAFFFFFFSFFVAQSLLQVRPAHQLLLFDWFVIQKHDDVSALLHLDHIRTLKPIDWLHVVLAHILIEQDNVPIEVAAVLCFCKHDAL